MEPGGRMIAYLRAGCVRLEPIEADRARPAGFYDFDLKPVPSPVTGKFEKAQVDYSAGKPGERCGVCEHFEAPRGCEKVAGDVDPGAWCRLFETIYG
jgi:hypothetical protein